LPDPNCTDPDAASPYPSNITVSGLTGTISDVNVTLTGVTHPFEGDIEALLVAPDGTNLVVLSDAGTGALSNATVTFDDAAAGQPPQNIAWTAGTYKPVNYTELSGADTFPAPAPAPSGNTTLGAFNGISPNGTWSLYLTDDACADAGSISGGWNLDITAANLAATSTSVISAPNPSTTGQSVTFTSTTLASGSPVTTGTVTFTEGASTLAANVPVNASGQASFTKSDFSEGNHIVTATYNANATFATSNGSINQRVNNATTGTAPTYCNTGPIAINDNAAGFPYPSNIFVTSGFSNIGSVTASLKNVTHAFAGDVEILLVGPAGQNLVLVSDAGTLGVTNVTVNLDDAAASLLPVSGSWAAANATITAKPTNYTELSPDVFPAPAPAPSAATTLATFNNTNSNGTWSLYVRDDGAPDTGSIAGGWCLTFTSGLATPTIATTASAGGVPGTLVHDTATLTGGASPTGNVTFTLFGPNNPTCTGAPIFTSANRPLSGGSAISADFPTVAEGTYNWVAVYSGDTANNAVTSPCGAANESVVIAKATPSIATLASAGGVPGTNIHDTATVSGGSSPTGSVTFTLFGPNNPTCTGAPIFTSANRPLSGGTATSADYPTTAEGTYNWVAVYNGDTANNVVTAPCGATNESASIAKATPTISTTASAGGPVGTQVHDTATVSGGSSPTGSVTFTLFGPNNPTCTGAPIFTSANRPLSGGSATSADFPPTAPGTYNWVAVYSGDAANNTVTSPCGAPNESATIVKASPAIGTAASPGGAPGTQVFDVATITGGSAPTGDVTFKLFSDSGCNTQVFTSTNSLSGGTATSGSYTANNPGTYYWTALYNGDLNNNTALSACGAPGESVTISTPTISTLTSSANPSVFGEPVTFTDTVCGNPPQASAPTGSVVFKDGATTLGTVALVAGGGAGCAQASLLVSALTLGSHPITATYAGVGTFLGSTGSLTQTVNPASTNTSVTSSVNPSVFGQPVTFTATVCPAAPSTATPTGNVAFIDGAASLGTVSLAPATGNCAQASVTTATLSVASHVIGALYQPTANFNSSAASLTQGVDKAGTTTVLTSAPNPSTLGQAVTLTAVVCPAPPSTNPSAPPSGTVTFADGASAVGSPVTLAPGGGPNCSQAAFTTNALGPGGHTLTATYSGDGNFTTSSGTATQNVTCANNVTGTVASVQATSGSTCIQGATVQGSVTVSPGAQLFISNSTIKGSVSSNGAAAITICGSTINGSVSVQNTSGFVLIGGDGAANCPGNILGSVVSLNANHGGLRLAGNRISGQTSVNNNNVTSPAVDPAGGVARIVVRHNTISAGLACNGNSPPASNDGVSNSVAGTRSGECSSPTF
jgi:subtilisin-like proprotein convertase family protein